MCGIIESDTVTLSSVPDAARFVKAVNDNPKQQYEIIDYEWVLVGGAQEILENPTGGYLGRMKNGKPDPK